MSGKEADEAGVCDASAYFSEEWKLLQEWQKELYRNVMKEIHQALLSLGPLIATTVCSLKGKDQEERCPMNDHLPESRQRIHHSPGDAMANSKVLFKINNEGQQDLNNPQHSERREVIDCFKAGFSYMNADNSSKKKEEPGSIFIDHLGVEIAECSTDPTAGYEIVSLRIKDEKEAYYVDHHDHRRMEINNPLTGYENMDRKTKGGHSIKYSERAQPYHVVSKKTKTMVPLSSKREANSRSQMWPESVQDFRRENTDPCESSFSNPVYFGLHPGIPTADRLDAYNEYESNLRDQHHKDFTSTHQNQRTYACADGEKRYSEKGDHASNMVTNSRERPYACTECEKSFFQKSHLITHYRAHSSDKPYVCPFCQKIFNRKDYLDGHVRIHTGERPYKCSKCEKSFIWKSHLNKHQRKHISLKTAKTAVF